MTQSKRKVYKIDRYAHKYLPWLIILQSFSPILFKLHIGKTYQIYNYFLYISYAIFCLWYFWKHRNTLVRQYPVISSIFGFMLLYVLASLIKLLYVPSSIFPYTRMCCFCSFCSLGFIFIMQQEGFLRRTIRLWWRYVPWITLISLAYIDKWYVMGMLYFTFFFLILSECLTRQFRFVTYFLYVFLVLFGIYQRMDYLSLIAPLAVFLMLKYHVCLTYKFSHFLFHLLMWIPVFFLILALTGIFNVLKFDSYIQGNYVSASGENMKSDTRTMLYTESISSSMENEYMFWGRTPGYGYDSEFVKSREGGFLRVEGVSPQRYSEVFAVNIFTWCGILGLFVWFVFYYWLGISTLNRARNRYIRAFVVYIGIFWVCDWISNNFCTPDCIYIMMFMIISVCVHPQLREMNDFEIKYYFKRMLLKSKAR